MRPSSSVPIVPLSFPIVALAMRIDRGGPLRPVLLKPRWGLRRARGSSPGKADPTHRDHRHEPRGAHRKQLDEGSPALLRGPRTGAWIGLCLVPWGTSSGWFGRRWRCRLLARCRSPQGERVNACQRIGIPSCWRRERCVRGKRFCGGIGLRRCPWKRHWRTLIVVVDGCRQREQACLILRVPKGPLSRLVFT